MFVRFLPLFLFAPDEPGAGGAPTPPPAAAPTPPPAPAAPAPTVDIAAAERRAAATARTEANEAMATQLGVSVEEAARIVASHRAAEEATQTEVQRAQAAAERARSDAERIRGEAASTLRSVHARSALVALGVADPAVQSDLVRLMDIPSTTAEADLPTVAAAQAETLRERYPAMFGAPGAAPRPAPSSTPGRAPIPAAAANGGMSAFDRGAQRAREAYPESARSRSSNPFDR